VGRSGPHLTHGSLDPHKSAPQTASRSVRPFLHSTQVCSTNRQANRHTDHATCDICSNRPNLCVVCRRCGLLLLIIMTSDDETALDENRIISHHSIFNNVLSTATKTRQGIPITRKQGVDLTRRNRTGPPCSVGGPTANAPGPPAALHLQRISNQKNFENQSALDNVKARVLKL